MQKYFFFMVLLPLLTLTTGCETVVQPVAPEHPVDHTMSGKAVKRTLCHFSADDGAFYRISVSINAADAHMSHGDVEFTADDPNCFPAPDFVSDHGIQFRRIPSGILEPCPQWATEQGVSCAVERDFYIGIFEVTQAEWESVMGVGTNPSRHQPPTFEECPRCPVETLGWHDALLLASNLNDSEETDTYRLPSEIEWEYAYRAGTLTDYYWGENFPPTGAALDTNVWYEGNSSGPPFSRPRTHSVGQKKPNAWGLYDMAGNVGEHQANLYQQDPDRAVLRGGSCAYRSEWLQAHYRFVSSGVGGNDDFGVRLVRDID